MTHFSLHLPEILNASVMGYRICKACVVHKELSCHSGHNICLVFALEGNSESSLIYCMVDCARAGKGILNYAFCPPVNKIAFYCVAIYVGRFTWWI